jgi:hypothetical protein
MVSDRELTRRIARFLKLLRYRVRLEYLLINEWSEGYRHVHILVRASGDLTSELVGKLWRKVTPGPRGITSSYCRPIRNPIGMARYIVKHVKDGGKKEVAPKNFEGRIMSYSKGFWSEPLRLLRQEVNQMWLLSQGCSPLSALETDEGSL